MQGILRATTIAVGVSVAALLAIPGSAWAAGSTGTIQQRQNPYAGSSNVALGTSGYSGTLARGSNASGTPTPGSSTPGSSSSSSGSTGGGSSAGAPSKPTSPPAWVTVETTASCPASSGITGPCELQIPNPTPGSPPVICSGADIAGHKVCGRYVSTGGSPGTSTTSAPSDPTIGGLGWSGEAQPVTVSKWAVVYGGQTYDYPGSIGLDTGYTIRASCTGSPTSGTVEYWLSVPPSSPPPDGWGVTGSVPPAPSTGPYASPFSVGACSPSDQRPAQVTLVPGKGPSVGNGYHVDADGTAYPFTFDPSVIGGVDQELVWNGGTASVSGYGAMVDNQIGQAYPRWQLSDLTGAGESGMAGTSGAPDVTVKLALHAPSNAGEPYVLGVTGSYSAYWEYWYLDVEAQAVATQESTPVPVGKWVSQTCEYNYKRDGKWHTHYWTCPYWQSGSLSYSYLSNIHVANATASMAPADPQSAAFSVSASTQVAAVTPMVTGP